MVTFLSYMVLHLKHSHPHRMKTHPTDTYGMFPIKVYVNQPPFVVDYNTYFVSMCAHTSDEPQPVLNVQLYLTNTHNQPAKGLIIQRPVAGMIVDTVRRVPLPILCNDGLFAYEIPRRGDPAGSGRYYAAVLPSQWLVCHGPLSNNISRIMYTCRVESIVSAYSSTMC